MAVFIITLLAVDTDIGRVLWRDDPPTGFMPREDPRYRQLEQNAGFLDFGAVLTRDEAVQLGALYLDKNIKMVEASSAKEFLAPFVVRAKALLDRIESTPKSDHVFIFARYWEMASESSD